ncbi:MAG: serine hydrolase domain-containing protein [Acidimicrobiales bacterium]
MSGSNPQERPVIVDRAGPQDLAFSLASVTKLLSAAAVLVAVEEETLALDGAAGPPDSTIAHLLAHASGLGLDGGIAAPPGRRRIYSNAGFDELGAAVSGSAGMSFVDYLTEAVLEPLSMTATSLEGSPGHGGRSTAADMARFAQELLRPQVLDRTTVDVATRVAFSGLDGMLPGFGPQRPNDWGLGFEIRAHKVPHWTGAANSPATFGHFGRSGTFLWVDPVAEVACVCLTDRPFGPWATEAWPKLSDTVLAAATD